ncbi:MULTISPECIES: hypothetical protein [Bradyrhizobium]|uniref:Uncharacterized protein n=1 Tax=Bradyrhizobium elkanii TaxID=29448 RepID=A0A8I1YE35_BRAEL|nr:MULTISPECIES: hypothetical protein [Bradyrhizobium]MBP1297075.1 hypothetical protein [Bradyrhizobium elkanii]QOZ17914.1 hypothetical protein XI02_24970 [Bradyrhizobium sp. CCBAU 21365]
MATATDTRAATAQEMAETNVLQSATEKYADTIQTRAADLAIKSLGAAESSTYNAVTMLALNLCGEQIRAVLTDNNYDPQKDAWIFTRDILVPVAKAGKMIWRGTESHAAAIMSATASFDRLSGDALKAAESERNKLASEYVKLKHTGATGSNGKPVNVKLIDSLQTLRTYGTRLASFMRLNHAPVILECARAASVESAETMWNAKVGELLSGQWGIMQSRLAEWHDMAKADKADKGGAEGAEAKAEAKAPESAEAEAPAPLTESEKLAAIMAAVDTLSIDALMTLQAHINAKVGASVSAEAPTAENVILLLPPPAPQAPADETPAEAPKADETAEAPARKSRKRKAA